MVYIPGLTSQVVYIPGLTSQVGILLGIPLRWVSCWVYLSGWVIPGLLSQGGVYPVIPLRLGEACWVLYLLLPWGERGMLGVVLPVPVGEKEAWWVLYFLFPWVGRERHGGCCTSCSRGWERGMLGVVLPLPVGGRRIPVHTDHAPLVAILPGHIHNSVPPWVHHAHPAAHDRAGYGSTLLGVHGDMLPGSVLEKPMGESLPVF